MKRALVLAGGGTRGIYQCGALRALHELGEDHFDMVLGVSVGALNAAMIVAGDTDRMEYMYDHLSADQIVHGFVPNDLSLTNILSERSEFLPQLQYYVQNGGIDIHPFYEMVDKYFDKDKFFASPVDYGCVTALKKDHSGVLVTKDMMKDNPEDWLIASASAYPAFPVKVIDGVEYVDGGYYDNFPMDYALRMGADEIIGIEMGEEPIHPLFLDKRDIHYIHPHAEMFNFLNFDHELMQKTKILGYNDTMKVYGKYNGEKYTFYPFPLPSYFDEYYRGLLMLETDIKNATSINERFRSEHVVSDKLKERLHVDHLTTRQYLYGILDALMDLCNADETRVWKVEDAKNLILAEFADCANEDFPYKPSWNPAAMNEYLQNLDEKGAVARIIHSNLYPDHHFITRNTQMTLYPFETALADFVTIMMRHLI